MAVTISPVISSNPVPKRKALADLEANPKHVTYLELLKVLNDHGWSIREGTKEGAIVQAGDRTFVVPRPHGKHLLPVYVRHAARLIREVEAAENEGDAEE